MQSVNFCGISFLFEFKSVIILSFYILHYAADELFVNKTNILYQYSILCGPDLFDESKNVWSLPKVPQQYKICPQCSQNRSCYHHGNCCPDLYLSFPTRECSDVIIYTQHADNHAYSATYEFISNCPENTYSELNENCIKNHGLHQQIRTPPVYSVTMGLSFKNQFCAFCHNVNDTIPWNIGLTDSCLHSPNLTVAEDILNKAIDDKCGTIEFHPGDYVKGKLCTNVLSSEFIDTCNVTGTWKKYDKDIEFACMNLGNSFKFYKNIFCYMCNPPDIVNETEVISECNITGKWDTYNKTIEDACCYGDITSAAYPFKNIYCFVCNTDIPRKNTFFLDAASNSLYEYFVFNISDGYDSYSFDNNTNNCQNSSKTLTEYHPWDVKFSCQSILPLSILDNDISNLQRLAIKEKCKVYSTQSSMLPRFPVKQNPYFADIFWAFLTDRDKVYLIGSDSLARCYSSYDSDLCYHLKGRFIVSCDRFKSVNNIYRLPVEYLFCALCPLPEFIYVDRMDTRRWNIFHIDSYDSLPQKCDTDEKYDEKRRKCRKTGCFIGKTNINKQCWQYETPYVIFENVSTSRIGYTLPVRFDVSINVSIDYVITELMENLTNMYNMSASFCHTLVDNGTWSSFYLQLDSSETSSTTKDEYSLLQFLSNLVERKAEYANFVISYDSATNKIVNQNNYFNNCKPGWRPLLSNILVCRNVEFNPDEYRKEENKITINGFRNVFDFYQYYIDADNTLWLCLDDFSTLQENDSPYDLYFVPITVCNVISTIFLLLTLTTYSLFPKLRTVPGKNIMSLSISLILHYITQILVMAAKFSGIGCEIVGIFAHYFLLTTFGCLFVCAWHMFKIFGTGSIASSMTASRNRYVIQLYVLFSYGYALVVIIGNVIFSIVVTSGNSIGYGDEICFIAFKGSVIATLLVPMIVLSGVDIVLYTLTVIRLKQRPQVNHNETMDRSDLWIFIKLFTVTGCSWILLLINAFINVPVIAAIISGLNGLQGFYIFTAYIFNKRIHTMYVSKFRIREMNQKKNRSPSTSVTSLSRLRTHVIERDSPLLQKRNITEC